MEDRGCINIRGECSSRGTKRTASMVATDNMTIRAPKNRLLCRLVGRACLLWQCSIDAGTQEVEGAVYWHDCAGETAEEDGGAEGDMFPLDGLLVMKRIRRK